RVVEQFPEDGQAWTILGVAHLRGGDAPQAVTALQKAKDLVHGDNATLWFYLAMAQWRADARQQASRSYEQARGWMEKNNVHDRELRGLQAEAAALLGVSK